MTTNLRRLGFSLCILLLTALPSLAQPAPPTPLLTEEPQEGLDAATNETSSLWFVELSSPPTADGTSLKKVRAEKASFRTAATNAGIRYSERYAFDTLFNGLSIRADAIQINAISRLAGVKAVWPVVTIERPAVAESSNPELSTAIDYTGARYTQDTLGFTGDGIKVGIIDTGIDYDHPDLGGCFGPGCRVAVGYDFVGNAYDANSANATYNPIPFPDEDPDDCGGHGTHVAGIVGGDGVVRGVAPGVTFGAYRVFGCVGSTEADIMILAMERALADGMDIVNMSIGAAYQWPQYPTALAANRMVDKGMLVVCSTGNNGANGMWSASAPGVGEKVIAAAAFDNSFNRYAAFTVSPDDRVVPYYPATYVPGPPVSGTWPLARTGTQTTADDACSALAPGSLTGQVALIRRGTCGFGIKFYNAQQAGAVGVVVYNNTGGMIIPSGAHVPPVTIPVVMITQTEGNILDTRLAGGPVQLTWTTLTVGSPVASAGYVSSFSSSGLAPDLTLKPDLGAPGGYIWSTYPIELGSYANLSGTSMASPHVAGAAALLLQARPNTPAQAIRSMLQNSASPKNWSGNPGLGFLEPVHRQGAGMIQIDKTILSTTKIEPGKLSLGESQLGPVTRTLRIENSGKTDVTYDLSHEAALATTGTFAISWFNSPATVLFSVPSIVVPAGGSALVDVTISPNAGLPDRSLYGGYIVFTPQGGGQTYRVPFSGFKGDFQSVQVLTLTVNNFPLLGTLTLEPASTFTLSGNSYPTVFAHLDQAPRMFRMEIYDAINGTSWHRAAQYDYLGRNSGANSYFAFPWDGWVYIATKKGMKWTQVPDGQYIIKVSVLKALGDASNPGHWESWTSPVFTIDRP